MLRVTFDTNVLDLVCRPERFPKDSRQPLMQKVRNTLANDQIKGFYSVTMLTIEGMMRQDRANVFSNTRLVPQKETSRITKNHDLPDRIKQIAGNADVETITLELQVEQPRRKQLHPEVINRIAAAKELGIKVLMAVPRNGAFHITDPTGDYYLKKGESAAAINAWNDKAHEVARAIEARGVGMAQVKALGESMLDSDLESTWFSCLDQAADIHQVRAVERAFSEWADGDSLAAHIAYGLDVFCSDDVGNSNATNSVLDSTHRRWLTEIYGVQFMTFEDLAMILS